MWINLITRPGISGSEGGIILLDEEYKGACRITLEKCPRYYAITCGIYGEMVHTAFCSKEDSFEKYEAMKSELADFLGKKHAISDPSSFFDDFTSKY